MTNECVSALNVTQLHSCAKIPRVGVEPETLTPVPQTITQLTKCAHFPRLSFCHFPASRENGEMANWENAKMPTIAKMWARGHFQNPGKGKTPKWQKYQKTIAKVPKITTNENGNGNAESDGHFRYFHFPVYAFWAFRGRFSILGIFAISAFPISHYPWVLKIAPAPHFRPFCHFAIPSHDPGTAKRQKSKKSHPHFPQISKLKMDNGEIFSISMILKWGMAKRGISPFPISAPTEMENGKTYDKM